MTGSDHGPAGCVAQVMNVGKSVCPSCSIVLLSWQVGVVLPSVQHCASLVWLAGWLLAGSGAGRHAAQVRPPGGGHTDLLAGWLGGWVVGWPVGWPVGWIVELMPGRVRVN